MKKLLLINNTQASVNVGCEMACKSIRELFTVTGGHCQIQDSLPLGYWADSFESIAGHSRDCIWRTNGYFPYGSQKSPRVPFRKWRQITERLGVEDTEFHERVINCDAVIVNGEGSIHHNFKRALAIMALMKTALLWGRPVLLLNATIQAMAPRILKDVLPKLSFIHARENRTFDELKRYKFRCFCAPDLAFWATSKSPIENLSVSQAAGKCLVTGGVITNPDILNLMFDIVIEKGFEPVYLCVGDGGEEKVAATVCLQKNIELVKAWEISAQNIISFLTQFPVAISGRHHINIFLLRAGVPFVPIPSNTWKIDGTLSQVDYPVDVVCRLSDLPEAFGNLLESRERLSSECQNSFDNGVRQIIRLKKELDACVY